MKVAEANKMQHELTLLKKRADMLEVMLSLSFGFLDVDKVIEIVTKARGICCKEAE